jgi:cold shock CspA family protein
MTTNGRDFGKIVFWNDRDGYGFVRPDTAERDLFFHVSALLSEPVAVGDVVSFELGSDKLHRPVAKSVLLAKANGGPM